MKAFVGEFEWWRMEPFADGFSIAADGLEASDVSCDQCRIENQHILYLYAKDGKVIDSLRVIKKDGMIEPLSIRHFNTKTGKWGEGIQAWDKTGEMAVHLPHVMEDVILVISCKACE